VLVIQAATPTLNPTIDRRIINKARADDPASAAAEWDAQFRSDLSQFIADEQIDACVNHSRPLELPPQPSTRYFAFVDASAGRHDHFTFAIGHKEGDQFVCDVLRGRKPPFDPASVAGEYAQLAKQYRVGTVVGDAYAGEWVAAAFKKCGIDYRRSKQPRSVLYLESMPAFVRGAVSIPDHSRLLRELRLLERRTSPSGKDAIDHGKNGSDDYANSLCGCIAITLKETIDVMAQQPTITGGKLFSLDTGVMLTNSVLADKPVEEKTEAQKIQEASLRQQAKEMAPPPIDTTLPSEAAARLEAFKKDRQKQHSLYEIFRPKLFGAH
jgi:hypothetical protein